MALPMICIPTTTHSHDNLVQWAVSVLSTYGQGRRLKESLNSGYRAAGLCSAPTYPHHLPEPPPQTRATHMQVNEMESQFNAKELEAQTSTVWLISYSGI